jgi:hypothetical protein
MTDIKEKTKLKDKLAKKKLEDELDQPIESCNWSNLFFSKEGKSVLGNLKFSSQEEAYNHGIKTVAWLFDKPSLGYTSRILLSCTWMNKNTYSHFIPVPVK